MPTTRSGDNTATCKAYYSKKAAPYQQRFPHRRKTVRRPDPHDASIKKQLKFLPEMMRRTDTVQDSDDESGEPVEDEEVEDVRPRKGRKRNSDIMLRAMKAEEDEEEPVRPTPKRRRKNAPVKAPQRSTRRTRADAHVAHISRDQDSDSDDETEQEDESRLRLRRQSTMTQLIDGRLPAPGSIEPEFKPVKQTPRTSWGGKRSKDMKKDVRQRTLTQMVHNLTPLILDSDEEADASTDDEVDAAYHSFIFGNEEEETDVRGPNAEEESLPSIEASSRPIRTHVDSGEDDYCPTQFIERPVIRMRRTPARSSMRHKATPTPTPATRTSPRTRFGLLSTPEKRGVFEIASSQSPPDTLLSTQNTPQRSSRAPLNPRAANALGSTDTPSKRIVETPSKRKQVTFQKRLQEQIPPPTLRQFASTIPDSEDELEDLSESEDASDADYNIGEDTQALLRNADRPNSEVNIGEETQNLLRNIDQACANADKDGQWASRDASEELGHPLDCPNDEVSQELGVQPPPRPGTSEVYRLSSDNAELPPLPFSSPKPSKPVAANKNSNAATGNVNTSTTIRQSSSLPPNENFEIQSPVPMFDDNESPKEEYEPVGAVPQQPSTPIKQQPRSSPIEDFRTQPTISMFNSDDASEDLDGAIATTTPVSRQFNVQVLRSPQVQLHSEPSHSSQAEQQLQFENQTYSHPHSHRSLPFPSSMHVAHDSNFSYQATPRPFPPQHPAQHLPQTYSSYVSQATTMDPTQISPKVTPRKPKIKKEPMFTRSAVRTPKSQRRARSATVTPTTQRRIKSMEATPKSQRGLDVGMSSPDAGKLPLLCIPSSYPSPARVTMEGWSSPVIGRGDVGETQWGQGSLEDFSIPAPPPGEWINDSDEDEEP